MTQASGTPAANTTSEAIIEQNEAPTVMNSRAGTSRITDEPLDTDFVLEESTVAGLLQRVARLEKRARLQFFALALCALTGAFFLFDNLLVEQVIVRQQLMESKELKLLDNDGNPRLFLRMYSKVPVLQIMDSNGKPRMSLGLRFDDSPFVELSDSTGRTRATFEITEDDAPALHMFDQNGNTTFNIN